MTTPVAVKKNPYVGPRAIETGEPLFGRDDETVELLNRVIADRVVLMYAVSGAGKTSLLKAGLVPALRSRDFDPLPIVQVRNEPPREFTGNRYTLSLLQYLETARSVDERLPPDRLFDLTLEAYLKERYPDKLELKVLVFDQFEDVLRIDPTDVAVKESFFQDVGRVLRTRGLRAVFVLREEFVAALDPYLAPIPGRFASRYRLPLLSPAAAEAAACGPAEAAGVPFYPEVATKLVEQLRMTRVQHLDGQVSIKPGPFVEPVQLQVVCQLLWERLPPGATSIGPEAIATFGVDRALEVYFDEKVRAAAQGTGEEEQKVREWVEKNLITEQGLRGQVLRNRSETAGLRNETIEALVNSYLVRAELRLGALWYELTHDRLVDAITKSNKTDRFVKARFDFINYKNKYRSRFLLSTIIIFVIILIWKLLNAELNILIIPLSIYIMFIIPFYIKEFYFFYNLTKYYKMSLDELDEPIDRR